MTVMENRNISNPRWNCCIYTKHRYNYQHEYEAPKTVAQTDIKDLFT